MVLMVRFLISFVLAIQIAFCPILCRGISVVCRAVRAEPEAEPVACEHCHYKAVKEKSDAPVMPTSPCPCGHDKTNCICSGAVFEAECHAPAPLDVSLDWPDLLADILIGDGGNHVAKATDETDVGFAQDGRDARTLICSLLC
jgi:hypothetical protein